ncbi:quinone-interacting membrane-bound oxidoreductase complex subunit QmoC [bacterium]|nr:quinone-interacting membrane-bound oxidoreductase complex subunit QmoC [bacterium]MBU1753746.1 quinone-interacting membrane-bound oxidoreductase complex subunit QmoC [bacterium]
MTDIIKPDLKVVKQIISSGGESLKKCYQCATCSVVCKLSPDDSPFPRKEMINAQWGLKDKLVTDPDIWLCHQCGDCTAYCPRGAKPGEVIGAVRKMTIAHYAIPKFLAKMVGEAKYLPLLIAFPVLFLLAVLGAIGRLHIPEGEIVFGHLMPHTIVDLVFVPIFMFSALVFAGGVLRFWRNIQGQCNGKCSLMSLIPTAISVNLDILSHKKFRKCEVNKGRALAHMGVLYGFIGLAITTALAVFYLYILKQESPYLLTSPLKIIGNLSAIALLTGITLVVINRFNVKAQAGMGSYFDWLFIGVIYTVVLSGILAEVTRLMGIAILAYPIYFVHLVSVFFLFLYAPYSKLAHMVYRTIALIHAKKIGREEVEEK